METNLIQTIATLIAVLNLNQNGIDRNVIMTEDILHERDQRDTNYTQEDYYIILETFR